MPSSTPPSRFNATLSAVVLLFALATTPLWAQTKVDMSKQAKRADFSQFTATRPWQLVSTLPLTCEMGEAVFVTSGVFGQQLHFCSPGNSWNLYTTTAVQMADFLDLAPVKTAENQLTIGPFCSAGRPCRARLGEKLVTVGGAGVITVGGVSATGTLFAWLDELGLHVGSSSPTGTVSCNSTCTVVPGTVSAFPAGSLPLAAVSYTGNVVDIITGSMDYRGVVSAQRIEAGPSANIAITSNGITGAAEIDLSETLDLGGFTATRVLKRGVAANRPVNCQLGDLYHQTNQTAGIYLCSAPATWQGPLALLNAVAPVEARVTSADLTGDAGEITLLAAGHAPGVLRVCAVVTVATGAGAPLTLSLDLSWRSPAAGTNQTAVLFTVPVASSTESQGCRILRTTGETAVRIDPSNADGASYSITLTAERMQ